MEHADPGICSTLSLFFWYGDSLKDKALCDKPRYHFLSQILILKPPVLSYIQEDSRDTLISKKKRKKDIFSRGNFSCEGGGALPKNDYKPS